MAKLGEARAAVVIAPVSFLFWFLTWKTTFFRLTSKAGQISGLTDRSPQNPSNSAVMYISAQYKKGGGGGRAGEGAVLSIHGNFVIESHREALVRECDQGIRVQCSLMQCC